MRAGTADSNPKVDSDDSAFLTLPMTVLASLAGGLTCTGLNSIMEDALGLAGISENTFTKIEGKWALAAETVLQSVLIENILQEAAAAYAQNSFNETFSGESCISIGVMGTVSHVCLQKMVWIGLHWRGNYWGRNIQYTRMGHCSIREVNSTLLSWMCHPQHTIRVISNGLILPK